MNGNYVSHSLPGVAVAAAEMFGDRIALVDGRRLTFQALNAEVRHAAGAFLKAGITLGDRVAIWAPNSIEWIIACLAAQRVGAAVVPMNTRLKGLEAQYILNKCRATMLITVNDFLSINYPALLQELELPYLKQIITFDGDWAEFLDGADGNSIQHADDVFACLDENGISDILFTSGTTGDPKGVVSTHRQSVDVFSLWSQRVGIHRDDRYLIVNPFFHSFGYKAGWLACLLTGATIYPLATLDIAAVVRIVTQERITVLPGPPTLFHTLLTAEPAQKKQLSSLRLSITGAASVPPALIERMRSELGIKNVLTGYGLTECGVATISAENDSAERVATTAGKPIPGIEVMCATAQGQPTAVGQEGEIWVRGFNVMQGYFEDETATAAAIDINGWLHTGDIGCFDGDGYLRITDRLKDMYICGGFNCYPAEIEKTLCRHPAIAQAAVIGVADERLGEVGKAFVVLRSDHLLDAENILHWCRDAMANYKVPRQVEIINALPVNAAGKVQKFLLRNL
jgi:acyl-CoA synthetase (AMP-forming)/AMP-acid ligase II